MLTLKCATLDLPRAVADLAEFDQLLMAGDELEESALQEFFSARPNLLLLMPAVFMPELAAAAYLPQCSILHEFRADYALANAERSQFLFIEFEHAKANSIFSTKRQTKSHQSFQWSYKFEHGLSQVIDWYYRLDDYQRTSRLQEHFGSQTIKYIGLLVIGRDCFLQRSGMNQRFEWRRKHTVVNSLHIHCVTFDELASALKHTCNRLLAVAATVA
jgi:hypothetical protein